MNSSYERIKGRDAEFDSHRPTVRIQYNTTTLPLALLSQAMNSVNDSNLWGLSRRMVKLSSVQYADNYYGTCLKYYRITYEFDINFNTFDRYVIDEGSKKLISGGDVNNPMHFERIKDCRGENTRAPLDGVGNISTDMTNPSQLKIEYYNELNFGLLNLPATL